MKITPTGLSLSPVNHNYAEAVVEDLFKLALTSSTRSRRMRRLSSYLLIKGRIDTFLKKSRSTLMSLHDLRERPVKLRSRTCL